MHVLIVGAGFSGSILARIARAVGHEVTLIERGQHPRFALGESSTPLAAITLQRMAGRYNLTDLNSLSSYGSWRKHLSDVRCGLKLGFTFYRHHPGEQFRNDAENSQAKPLLAPAAHIKYRFPVSGILSIDCIN